MNLLTADEVKGQHYASRVLRLCGWKEPSLIKYVAPPAYIRMSLLLRATGRGAVALKYMHSGGKRGSKSRSELLDCFATCMSEG